MKKILLKINALFCSCLMVIMYCVPATVSSAEKIQLIHNLVIFAQFPNEDKSYNFMDGRTEKFIDMCQKENTVRSMSGYIDRISYGKTKTDFVYPQITGNTVKPYIFSQQAEKYLNTELALIEAISSVAVDPKSDLDGNGDGIVDNIIVLVDGDSEMVNQMFWPSKNNLSGIEINDLRSGAVNVHNSKSIFSDLISGGAGVLCHEFLHSLGYPDLYRTNDRPGNPVGL